MVCLQIFQKQPCGERKKFIRRSKTQFSLDFEFQRGAVLWCTFVLLICSLVAHSPANEQFGNWPNQTDQAPSAHLGKLQLLIRPFCAICSAPNLRLFKVPTGTEQQFPCTLTTRNIFVSCVSENETLWLFKKCLLTSNICSGRDKP